MSELKILSPEDKKLRKISKKVTDFENKSYYEELINKMKEICIGERAYACAAPQFGILKRFILIMTEEEIESLDSPINYKITSYFNPEIISQKGEQIFLEACMSTGDIGGIVRRPYSVRIKAQDINGKEFFKAVKGFESIVLCHEIDHLDGIEFTDKAEVIYYNVNAEARSVLRKKYPYRVINQKNKFIQKKVEKTEIIHYN